MHMDARWETLEWPEIGVRCPECGNAGHPGLWEAHAHVPFQIMERVARMWSFVPKRTAVGPLVLEVVVDSEAVDWESGSGLGLLCMACFSEFEINENLEVDFG